MGIVAIVLALIVCVVAYSLLSGGGQASPTPAAATPTRGAALLTAAPSVLAPSSPPAGATPARITPPPAATTSQPAQPQLASACDGRTAETRYVVDANGAYVFDSAQDNFKVLGLLTFRTSVQVYGTIEGRQSSNSNMWFLVRYNNACAYVWADPKQSRLSTTKPK
jgi:hypothetical protein